LNFDLVPSWYTCVLYSSHGGLWPIQRTGYYHENISAQDIEFLGNFEIGFTEGMFTSNLEHN